MPEIVFVWLVLLVKVGIVIYYLLVKLACRAPILTAEPMADITNQLQYSVLLRTDVSLNICTDSLRQNTHLGLVLSMELVVLLTCRSCETFSTP